ncbi:MAG: 16S rRNA (cytosine(1402)-N(4))-methyltransferase RsmH, partial [Oscillospiraceae bacterium]|nr:16S rRNA (cytosine(1402)-N(4))-methyltransferase RsmH [Oscillospiraceae bacterium]
MEHVSVLLKESVEGLRIRPDGVYADATLGLGGHSMEIARRLTTGRLIAIDRDGAAIGAARERLRAFEDKITFVRGNFRDLAQILDGLGIGGADGMLFDFGVSSPQLDNPERGFSYMSDAPLDMRMDERDT